MVAAVALQRQTQPKNQQFYKLIPEQLKQDYKAKILTAEAYIYYLIKAKRAAEWEWHFNVKNFCAEWEIAESTFYRALSKLRVKNLVFWRPGDNTVVLWWNQKVAEMANVDYSDSPNSQNPDTAIALPDVREQFPDVREQFPDVREPLPDVREQNAEIPTVVESCNASYSLQIDPEKHTDFKKEVCVFSGEVEDLDPEFDQQSIHHHDDEINQDAIPGSRTALLNDAKTLQVVDTTIHEGLGFVPPICKDHEPNQESTSKLRTRLSSEVESLQVANITSSEGRGFAAPVRKTSQKQEWICPGSEEEKKEFLIFKGGLLVASKKCEPVESRTAALGWANRNPDAANLLWEDWQREKVQDANQNTAIATVPEFRRMHEQEHVAVLDKFINLTAEEFLKLCWWHEYWLKFAVSRLGQELIPGLTPEIIKQIKAH
jgi:hypothetical protein